MNTDVYDFSDWMKSKVKKHEKELEQVRNIIRCVVCNEGIVKNHPYVNSKKGIMCDYCGSKHNPIAKIDRVSRNHYYFQPSGDIETSILTLTRKDGTEETFYKCDKCRSVPCKHMEQDKKGNWKLKK